MPVNELQYITILPEIILSVGAIIAMLVDPLLGEKDDRRAIGIISLFTLLAALVASVYQMSFSGSSFFNVVRVDAFSIFFHITVIVISILVVLFSFEYMKAQSMRLGEYYALILCGTAGMCLMSSAMEL